MSSSSVRGPITIRWERRALKEAASLPKADRLKVLAAVESLTEKPLRGECLSGQWKGMRRLRVGYVRVIYAFDGRSLLILVLRVRHRREVYKA